MDQPNHWSLIAACGFACVVAMLESVVDVWCCQRDRSLGNFDYMDPCAMEEFPEIRA